MSIPAMRVACVVSEAETRRSKPKAGEGNATGGNRGPDRFDRPDSG